MEMTVGSSPPILLRYLLLTPYILHFTEAMESIYAVFIDKIALQFQACNPMTHTTEANSKRLHSLFQRLDLSTLLTGHCLDKKHG